MGIAPDARNASQLRLDQRRSRATKRIEEQIRLIEIEPLYELPNEMGWIGQHEPIPVMNRPVFSLDGVDPRFDSHTVIFTVCADGCNQDLGLQYTALNFAASTTVPTCP